MVAWQSSSLDGAWKRWGEASCTREGMNRRSRNIACNSNVIIASFSYDKRFKDSKRIFDNGCVACFENSRWKKAEWESFEDTTGRFCFLNNHGIYIDSMALLLSENGYKWKETEFIPLVHKGGLCGNVFMTEPDSLGQALISLDGLSIHRLTVSETRWKEFCFGDGKVLVVPWSEHKSSPLLKVLNIRSKHKSSLLLGTLNIIKK